MTLRWPASTCVFVFALAAPAASAQDAVARMGAIVISAAEVKALLDAQPPETRKALAESPEALEQSLRTELVRRAVAAEAQAQGWDKRQEVAARLARAREEVIVTTYVNNLARPAADYPTDAEVQAFYNANRDKLQLPKRYRVSQIYVKRPPEKPAADAAAKKIAELAAKARAPGADFAALAKAGSEHESAGAGGDVGWLADAAMIPEIRPVIAKLSKGAVSEPVQTAEGWHVLKLIDVAEAGPAPLDAVRPQIVNTLRLQRAQELERKYIDGLLAKTPVAIDKAALDKLK
jgi:peptidylprolyl isomerase